MAYALTILLVVSLQGVNPDSVAQRALSIMQNATENDVRRSPTADELLEELNRSRPLNEVILSSAHGRDDDRASSLLLPEGWSVVDQTGRIERKGQWWTFVVEDGEAKSDIKLLPNAALEVMVRTASGADGPMRFTVSGELTIYRGENYLLARAVMRSTQPAEKNNKQSSGGNQLTRPVSTTAPAGDVQSVLESHQPDRRFLGDDPTEIVRTKDTPRAPSARVPTLKPDGTPLVKRPARIVLSGAWHTLILESDHPDAPEPPLKLLPSRATDRMVQDFLHDPIGLVFVVSGEITLFEGENFLLPKVAVRQLSSGNLRP